MKILTVTPALAVLAASFAFGGASTAKDLPGKAPQFGAEETIAENFQFIDGKGLGVHRWWRNERARRLDALDEYFEQNAEAFESF